MPPSTTNTSSATGPSLKTVSRASVESAAGARPSDSPPTKPGATAMKSGIAMQYAAASNIPGNTPARNIAPTDCSVTTA